MSCANCGVRAAALAVAGVLGISAATANAAVLTFGSQVHGKPINTQYQNYEGGVNISATNAVSGHPNMAIIFDTRKTGTADPDLQAPFSLGNIPPSATGVGNILIIAENSVDANHDGLIDSPDDEGHRPAGFIDFKFNQNQYLFGLDLVDVDGPQEYNSGSGYLSFRSGGTEVGRVGFGAFVTPTSPFYDPTVVYGNNSSNHIQPITAPQLGVRSFNEVVVNYGGSGGIDNITFSPTPVPEPGVIGAGVIACGAVMSRRRRSNRG